MKKAKIIGNVIGMILVLAFLTAGVFWTIWQWKLCKANDLGTWYCIQHILK